MRGRGERRESVIKEELNKSGIKRSVASARSSAQTAQTAADTAQTTANNAVLVGEITGYAGVGDPANGKWLLCDGRVLGQGDWPELFAVIGIRWNVGGESATQFRLPDLRGRVEVGAGDAPGLTPRPLASRFGAGVPSRQ